MNINVHGENWSSVIIIKGSLHVGIGHGQLKEFGHEQCVHFGYAL